MRAGRAFCVDRFFQSAVIICLNPASCAQHAFAGVIALLQAIVDRDVFRDHYRAQLAKRLLMSNGVDIREGAEQRFLAKLKVWLHLHLSSRAWAACLSFLNWPSGLAISCVFSLQEDS